MTILEHTPTADDLLDFLDQSIRQLAETDAEARYILMGPAAYDLFRKTLAASLRRGKGDFETYNYLPVVVDPFREASVCVVPAPAGTDAAWQPFKID